MPMQTLPFDGHHGACTSNCEGTRARHDTRVGETKNNGRLPRLAESVKAGLKLWHRFHHTLRSQD